MHCVCGWTSGHCGWFQVNDIHQQIWFVRAAAIDGPSVYLFLGLQSSNTFYYCNTFSVNPEIEEMFRLASQGNEIVFTLCLSSIAALTTIFVPLRHKQSKPTCSCCWCGEGNLQRRTSNNCWITAAFVFFAIEKPEAHVVHDSKVKVDRKYSSTDI